MFARNEAPTMASTTATKLLLTVPEAAAKLGLSRSLFYTLVLEGKVRSVKIGKCRRIPYIALEEYVAHCLTEQKAAS